jgi:large subunit ribosomal protein L6
VPPQLTATIADGKITFARAGNEKSIKALHGLYRALTANMVRGVTEGYSKELEIVGVGFRAQLKGKSISLYVGFSHEVVFEAPEGITFEVPKPTIVIVKGADRQAVGQVAANIRRSQPPEPYKGKGIKYAGEVIRRKAGKAATGAKGGAAK